MLINRVRLSGKLCGTFEGEDMKLFIVQVFGAAFFASAMFAIGADSMPPWGPFSIGGAAWMLSLVWLRALIPHNVK